MSSRSATRRGRTGEFKIMCDQAYWLFREDAEKGLIRMDINDDVLNEELTSTRYNADGRKIKLEPKEDIKTRIGRSPDRADAVVMAFSIEHVRPSVASVAAAW